MLTKPLNLRNSYYRYGETQEELNRMPAGFFHDPACLYEQLRNCTVRILRGLYGVHNLTAMLEGVA